jgi:uncharacterized membrane protein
MNLAPNEASETPGGHAAASADAPVSFWQRVQRRMFGGLLLILPILITLWLMHWLYSSLEKHVIDPIARVVLWQVGRGQPETELPVWFETYAAPAIAVVIVLTLLYVLGFLAHTGLRQMIDSLLMRLPLVSTIYNGVRNVFQTLDKKRDKPTQQRMVLVAFPQPGMRTIAFVTGSCRDVATQKLIYCVYVPTTPVPTSGYFLLVPEEDITPLNWTSEQALQAIISGGLTAPAELSYFADRQTASAEKL